MIPEDGVGRWVRCARLVKWGTGLPMMYPCDLISRPWVPNVEQCAEIQQRWLAWRPALQQLLGSVDRRSGDTVRLSPSHKRHSNPIRPVWRSRISPWRRESHFPVFPSVSCLSLERSLQRLWNGLTDVVLLHAVCTRLSPPDRPCRVFLCSNQMCGDAREIEGRRAQVLCSSSCAAPWTYWFDTTAGGVGGRREEASFMLQSSRHPI